MRVFLALFFCLTAQGSPWEGAVKETVRRALPHPARIVVTDIQVQGRPDRGAEVSLLSRRPLGLVSLQWRWRRGDSVHTVGGSAQVRAFAPVAVARRSLKDGEPFGDEVVRFEEKELGPLYASGYFTVKEDLDRLRARGFTPAGAVLTSARVEAPVLVQPGHLVELVRERGSMRVTARVEALQRGREQEWIRVRNPSTRRTLQAKVAGPGLVVIP